MSLLGGNLAPTSGDARWEDWARPVVAAVRAGLVAVPEVVAFCAALGADSHKAANLLSWCWNEGLVTSTPRALRCTAWGLSWLGDYVLPEGVVLRPPPVAKPGSQPKAPRRPQTTVERVAFGVRYGRSLLTPISEWSKDRWNNVVLLCECTCGRQVRVRWTRLRKGLAKSCGHHATRPSLRAEAAA